MPEERSFGIAATPLQGPQARGRSASICSGPRATASGATTNIGMRPARGVGGRLTASKMKEAVSRAEAAASLSAGRSGMTPSQPEFYQAYSPCVDELAEALDEELASWCTMRRLTGRRTMHGMTWRQSAGALSLPDGRRQTVRTFKTTRHTQESHGMSITLSQAFRT